MSALVPKENIPYKLRERMIEELQVRSQPKAGKNSKYNKQIIFNTYDMVDDDTAAVPFAYYYQHLQLGYPNEGQDAPKMKSKFMIKLFDRQKTIRDETFEILNDTHSILISLWTGFGKSLYSLYVACKIGYKTTIVCHRVRLITQWKESIIRACGSDTIIQIVGAKTEIDPEADFYIINVVNLPKRNRFDLFHSKTVIIDEAHTICTEKFSRGLNYLFPKYLIGLTATPFRSDGQDKVIELFVGHNMIYRPLKANFNVYHYKTGFKPETKKNSAGDLDWNAVLKSQAENRSRNELIVDLCRYFSRRNILLLCKRKDQAQCLYSTLIKYKQDATLFVGSTKNLNIESRIIIATCSKGSVGMDAPKLDMLIVAADVEDGYIQMLGRVFRRENHFPIILELIDNFGPFFKHSKTKTEILIKAGGIIKNFKNYFSGFDKCRSFLNTNISETD